MSKVKYLQTTRTKIYYDVLYECGLFGLEIVLPICQKAPQKSKYNLDLIQSAHTMMLNVVLQEKNKINVGCVLIYKKWFCDFQ